MSVYLYQRTRRHIPEDNSWELKSHPYKLQQHFKTTTMTYMQRVVERQVCIVKQFLTDSGIRAHGLRPSFHDFQCTEWAIWKFPCTVINTAWQKTWKCSGHRLYYGYRAILRNLPGWRWWNKGQRAWIPKNRDQISVRGTSCNTRAGSLLRVLLGPFPCAG